MNELFVNVLFVDSPIDGNPWDELECCGPFVVLAVFRPTFEHQNRLIAINTWIKIYFNLFITSDNFSFNLYMLANQNWVLTLKWASNALIEWVDKENLCFEHLFTCGWQPTTMKMNTPCSAFITSGTIQNACRLPSSVTCTHEIKSKIHETPITTTSLMHTRPKAALYQRRNVFKLIANNFKRMNVAYHLALACIFSHFLT